MSLVTPFRDFLPEDSVLGHYARRWYRRLTPSKPRPLQGFVLDGLAAAMPVVRFVQVGSNDAGFGDPLRYHILHSGWRGLMVEPLPFVFERLKKRYTGIEGLNFANVAIDKETGTRPFYYLRPDDDEQLPPWYDQLGSFLKENVLKHRKFLPDIADRIREMPVRCLNFRDLCDEYGVNNFDLLHIDAEGYDYEILRTVDFSHYRPAIVLFEHRHLSADDYAAALAQIHTAGYLTHQDPADTLAVHQQSLKQYPKLMRAWRYVRGLQGKGTQGSNSEAEVDVQV